jgi:hypothetical protein
VLEEQDDQRVALVGRPLMPSASLTYGAFNDVATGVTPTAQGPTEPLCPRVVETQQVHELDELIAVQHLPGPRIEHASHRRG